MAGDCDLHSVSESDEGSNDEERGHPHMKKNCANTPNLGRRCTLGYIWTKAGMGLFASCVNDMHLVILRPNKELVVFYKHSIHKLPRSNCMEKQEN